MPFCPLSSPPPDEAEEDGRQRAGPRRRFNFNTLPKVQYYQTQGARELTRKATNSNSSSSRAPTRPKAKANKRLACKKCSYTTFLPSALLVHYETRHNLKGMSRRLEERKRKKRRNSSSKEAAAAKASSSSSSSSPDDSSSEEEEKSVPKRPRNRISPSAPSSDTEEDSGPIQLPISELPTGRRKLPKCFRCKEEFRVVSELQQHQRLQCDGELLPSFAREEDALSSSSNDDSSSEEEEEEEEKEKENEGTRPSPKIINRFKGEQRKLPLSTCIKGETEIEPESTARPVHSSSEEDESEEEIPQVPANKQTVIECIDLDSSSSGEEKSDGIKLGMAADPPVSPQAARKRRSGQVNEESWHGDFDSLPEFSAQPSLASTAAIGAIGARPPMQDMACQTEPTELKPPPPPAAATAINDNDEIEFVRAITKKEKIKNILLD